MKKIGFVFSGQGVQYVGMGKKLFDKYLFAQPILEEASDFLGYNVKRLCLEGPQLELNKTEYTQPVLITIHYLSYKAFTEEYTVTPHLLAGHSFGEISALLCAGCLTFHDALLIANQRGRLIQEAAENIYGAMLVVFGVQVTKISEICRHLSKEGNRVSISNYNSPDQIVVAGYRDAVSDMETELKKMGARVKPLSGHIPFHTSLLEPASEKWGGTLQNIRFLPATIPVISNIDARLYTEQDDICEKLQYHVSLPVQWSRIMKYMSIHMDFLLESGPGNVLRNIWRRTYPDIPAFSYDSDEDFDKLHNLCKQPDILPGDREFMSRCLSMAVCSQNKNNDSEYIKKCEDGTFLESLKAISKSLQHEDGPDEAEISEAYQFLLYMLDQKRVPFDEIKERISNIGMVSK